MLPRNVLRVLLCRLPVSLTRLQVVNIANDQRTLKDIENKILYMLANASGTHACAARKLHHRLSSCCLLMLNLLQPVLA